MNIREISNIDLVNNFEIAVRQDQYNAFHSEPLPYTVEQLKTELTRRLSIDKIYVYD